ncbi:MAG: adenosine kinase [Thermodesulfobacteriota bacterium]
MKNDRIHMIGVGSPVVDLVIEVPEQVVKSVPGQKGGMELVDSRTMSSLLAMIGGQPVKATGGSAGNTTFALSSMGLRCSFMGKLGRDENGAYYRDYFKQIGGDCSRFKLDGDAATASCLSLVTPDSERTMRTDLGAAMAFSPEDIHPEDFAGCDHVHVEGYLLFNPELILAVLKAAKEAGCRVSLDLGSFEIVDHAREALPGILENYVDVVFANEEESAVYCGKDDPEYGLEELGKLCSIAAVKLGKKGALVRDAAGAHHVPAFMTDRAVDTTGAGDFWAAGFLYGLINHHPVDACAKTGALLGRHVVEHLGAALPLKAWRNIMEETNQILNRI